MKRLITIALAAFAFANVAYAQSTTDEGVKQSVDQRQAFDYLTKFSPL
jgi:hypothetical protein